jgi:hypothetical protein
MATPEQYEEHVQGTSTPQAKIIEWFVHLKCTYLQSGCCYGEVPVAESTYCSSADSHAFCLPCASKYADTEIGNMKYYQDS